MSAPRRSRSGDNAQRAIRLAYEQLIGRTWTISTDGRVELAGLRDLVRESWQRSLAHLPDPGLVQAPVVWSDAELREQRARHPLSGVAAVIQRLLVDPSADTGIVVAVGDEHGRLMWVDGDRATLRRTEQMLLRPGAEWSENAMGTSAPGTALVLDAPVQILGAEHFVPVVQRWSCTAVPVHDPRGRIIGVVDVTGGAAAVGARTLAWVQAAVGAIEAELRLVSRGIAVGPGVPHPSCGRERPGPAALSSLGRRAGVLSRGGRSLELTLRHTEILLLLGVHPAGLSAEQLLELLGPRLSAVTLRAEISRLRRTLAASGWSDLAPASRPYRLPAGFELDGQRVLDHVMRGNLDRAVEEYAGSVLPGSDAPGIARWRRQVSASLREAVLADGSLAVVLAYLDLPEVQDDIEAWTCALRMLPVASPRRAVVVVNLQRLEDELR